MDHPGRTVRARSHPAAALLWPGLAALALACAPDGPPPPDGWEVGAASVRPSVQSVWGSRPAVDGLRAYSPLGTGFVVLTDSAGAVLLTNAHVVADTSGAPYPRLSVLTQADTGSVLYGAEVLALDRRRDLALLRVPDTTLVPVRWRRERVSMGTPLATIGYGLPEGGIVDTTGNQVTTRFTVSRRFTAGYASAYRTLEAGDPSTNILEVDLFLFPGVSGGPTFTRDGTVVGVNQGGLERGSGTTSYGHVIPVLVVRQFLDAAGYGRAVFGEGGG